MCFPDVLTINWQVLEKAIRLALVLLELQNLQKMK